MPKSLVWARPDSPLASDLPTVDQPRPPALARGLRDRRLHGQASGVVDVSVAGFCDQVGSGWYLGEHLKFEAQLTHERIVRRELLEHLKAQVVVLEPLIRLEFIPVEHALSAGRAAPELSHLGDLVRGVDRDRIAVKGRDLSAQRGLARLKISISGSSVSATIRRATSDPNRASTSSLRTGVSSTVSCRMPTATTRSGCPVLWSNDATSSG